MTRTPRTAGDGRGRAAATALLVSWELIGLAMLAIGIVYLIGGNIGFAAWASIVVGIVVLWLAGREHLGLGRPDITVNTTNPLLYVVTIVVALILVTVLVQLAL